MSLRRAFAAQKCDAKRRGIPFLLTFCEWLDIWLSSDHLDQRGHGKGRYVMARYGDRGAYEIGNVRIILFEENCYEYRPTVDARRRIGLGHKGKVVSQATRKKLAEAAIGSKKTFSPETKARLSASRRRIANARSRDEYGQWLGGSPCH